VEDREPKASSKLEFFRLPSRVGNLGSVLCFPAGSGTVQKFCVTAKTLLVTVFFF